jgi:hypothetical protein
MLARSCKSCYPVIRCVRRAALVHNPFEMQVNPSNFAAADITTSMFSGKATLTVVQKQGVLRHELGPPSKRAKFLAAAPPHRRLSPFVPAIYT